MDVQRAKAGARGLGEKLRKKAEMWTARLRQFRKDRAARKRERPEKGKWYRRTDRGARFPLALFMPFALILLCQMVTVQSLAGGWSWMMEHPGATLWTWAALLLVQTAVERLSRSLLAGALVITIPCFLLAVASYLKLAANGVPLFFSDLAMIGQAAEITGFLSPEMGLGDGTWGAIFLLLVTLLLVFLWSRPLHKETIRFRLFTAGGALFLLLLLVTAPFTAALMEDPEKEGGFQAERNERLGVLGGMYAAARTAITTEPDAYNEENMNRILLEIAAKAPKVATPRVKPNVILLLSESFYDPTRLPNVTFSTDPIPNYRALSQEYPSGLFLSNTFAGGTGNVEIEILSGIPTTMINPGEYLTSITGDGVYERMPSVAAAFQSQGYQTTYVHSHDTNLYARTTHFPAMGFEKLLFWKDFTVDITRAGPNVSDDCWVEQIIAEFESKEEGKPIFLMGMSMENHQPYTATKYSEPSPVKVSSPLLDEAAADIYEAVVHGLYDADQALKKVVDYFSKVEEPTIIIFVGDHLPPTNLGKNDTIYDRLKYTSTYDTSQWEGEELKKMVSTNYLIWNNYGAELEMPKVLSSTGLGTWMLEWAGLPKPLYFYWMDTVLKDMSMVRSRLFVTAEGEPYHDPPKKYEALMKRYQTIVYDILYGEHYITNSLIGSGVRKTVYQSNPEIVDRTEDLDDEEPVQTAQTVAGGG